MTGLPTGAEHREQLWSLSQHWMNWAVSYPEKRRALAQLGVSDEITPEIRAAGHKAMAGVAGLLEQIRASGPMRKAPMGFVGAIMNSIAEATIDFMTQDSTHAKQNHAGCVHTSSELKQAGSTEQSCEDDGSKSG